MAFDRFVSIPVCGLYRSPKRLLTQNRFVSIKYPVYIDKTVMCQSPVCSLYRSHKMVIDTKRFCVNPRFVACIGATKWLLTQYCFVLIKYAVCIDGCTCIIDTKPFCVNPRFVACIVATKWSLTQLSPG